jgi:putative N6-adenine-specific DNA methylase
LTFIATTPFGLEAVVSRELLALGYADQTVSDGRVVFTADWEAVPRCNLWLRCADRLLWRLAEFEARDFGELFDRSAAVRWAETLPVDAAFPVRARSTRSQLHHTPTVQSIVKKAVVESLRRRHAGVEWFEETGTEFAVDVSVVRDVVTLAIDTSGAGLHKRGYRTLTGPSPLKETLAAALVQLSFWDAQRPLWDPFCGTGTIAIEAALIGRNIAPGLGRRFAAESWPQLPADRWRAARTEAADRAAGPLAHPIHATDIDAASLRLARTHAAAAGVTDDIHFEQKPFRDISTRRQYGCLIGNPPYGERSGTRESAEALYREFPAVFERLPTWSFYVLTAHTSFEKIVGRQADRRRKLYNARIPCTYYQFHGPRPPRPAASSPHSPAESEPETAP